MNERNVLREEQTEENVIMHGDEWRSANIGEAGNVATRGAGAKRNSLAVQTGYGLQEC